MLEKNFQRKVIKYIESKSGYVINYNPGGVGKGGASDIIASINGIFVAIELKVNHALQQRQALNLHKVNQSGGVGIILFQGQDWKEKLDNLFMMSPDVISMRKETHIIPKEFLSKVNWED